MVQRSGLMNRKTPELACCFEQAELNTLRAGLAMSNEAKIQWDGTCLRWPHKRARWRAEVDAEYCALLDTAGLLAHLRKRAERIDSLDQTVVRLETNPR